MFRLDLPLSLYDKYKTEKKNIMNNDNTVDSSSDGGGGKKNFPFDVGLVIL